MNQSQRDAYLRKHERLMEMIRNYRLTQEESERLQKVKEETELEIAMRFLKSQANKNYTFPLKEVESDDQIQEFPGRVSFQETFYDLCNQNHLPSKQKISKDTTSRRVKSLGPEKGHESHYKIRVTERVQTDRDPNFNSKVRLPKIQSSKIVFTSLEKLPLSSTQEKKTFKIRLNNNKNVQKETHRQLDHYGNLLTKKLLTEQQQTIQIGVTKVLINKRIHSPVKPFPKNLKTMQKIG